MNRSPLNNTTMALDPNASQQPAYYHPGPSGYPPQASSSQAAWQAEPNETNDTCGGCCVVM